MWLYPSPPSFTNFLTICHSCPETNSVAIILLMLYKNSFYSISSKANKWIQKPVNELLVESDTKWSPLFFLCWKTQIINMQSLEQNRFDDIFQWINITWGLSELRNTWVIIIPIYSFWELQVTFFVCGSGAQHNPTGKIYLTLNPLLGKARKSVESCKWHGSFQTEVCHFPRLQNVSGWVSLW